MTNIHEAKEKKYEVIKRRYKSP